MSRTLAIGDIHGCSAALDALLTVVAPAQADIVIALGDYVDRGPDSKGVLERLLRIEGRARLVPLIGNHDQMMLEARDGGGLDWQAGYGDRTIASYGRDLDRSPRRTGDSSSAAATGTRPRPTFCPRQRRSECGHGGTAHVRAALEEPPRRRRTAPGRRLSAATRARRTAGRWTWATRCASTRMHMAAAG
jgi:hypothetical protein